jgi:hypothetical protein
MLITKNFIVCTSAKRYYNEYVKKIKWARHVTYMEEAGKPYTGSAFNTGHNTQLGQLRRLWKDSMKRDLGSNGL